MSKFTKLTRPTIRALKTGQRINEHGIAVERLKSGDIRFKVNIMVDGQRIHRVIGKESEGVTREQAERAVESFRTKAREGRLDLPKGRKVHRNFEDAARVYLQTLSDSLTPRQRGYTDIENKRRHIERYLIPYFGSQRIDKIKDFAVIHYSRERLSEGMKQASVNRELATLSHLLNRAVQWKWIKAEDKPAISKGKEPRKIITILPRDEQIQLMRAATGDQDPNTWLFVAFGLNTAMRHGEILKTRWEHIDFETNRLLVPEAKAGQRHQPITSSLSSMLLTEREQRLDQTGWIFPVTRSDNKSPHRKKMAKQFRRTVLRAGMDPKKVTPHVMRHTAITHLVQAGVDIPTIQKISGHKTLAMVMRYVHLADSHIDSAIAAIDIGMPDTVTPELHTGKRLRLVERKKV